MDEIIMAEIPLCRTALTTGGLLEASSVSSESKHV